MRLFDMRGRRLRNRTSWKEHCHGWVPEILNFWCIHSPFILGHPNDLTNTPKHRSSLSCHTITVSRNKTWRHQNWSTVPPRNQGCVAVFPEKQNINKSTVAASTSFLCGFCCLCLFLFLLGIQWEPSPAHSFKGFGSCWLPSTRCSTRFSSRIVTHHSFTKVPPGHSRSSPASSASGRVLGRCSFQLERYIKRNYIHIYSIYTEVIHNIIYVNMIKYIGVDR